MRSWSQEMGRCGEETQVWEPLVWGAGMVWVELLRKGVDREEMRPEDSRRRLGRKTQEGHWDRILWAWGRTGVFRKRMRVVSSAAEKTEVVKTGSFYLKSLVSSKRTKGVEGEVKLWEFSSRWARNIFSYQKARQLKALGVPLKKITLAEDGLIEASIRIATVLVLCCCCNKELQCSALKQHEVAALRCTEPQSNTGFTELNVKMSAGLHSLWEALEKTVSCLLQLLEAVFLGSWPISSSFKARNGRALILHQSDLLFCLPLSLLKALKK